MSQPGMPRPPSARRARRYRRRLRSRIILSFVLLGFGLTALFAWSVGEVRDQVEDKLVVDVMNRNIDLYAQQYERDPQNPTLPVDQMRAFAFTPDKFESVRESQPDWYELPDGIHGLSNVDEQGRAFSYKLAVRKTPQVWFFLAYDMSQTMRGQEQFNRAIYGSVVAFTLLSLLVGWWAASRVMSPVSELARRLKESGTRAQPEALATHFPEDEVGQLAAALDDYAARLTHVSYARGTNDGTQDPFGENGNEQIGLKGVPNDPRIVGGITGIDIAGHIRLGSPNFMPKFQHTNQFQWIDTTELGEGPPPGEVRRRPDAADENEYFDVAPTRGNFSFTRSTPATPLPTSCSATCSARS